MLFFQPLEQFEIYIIRLPFFIFEIFETIYDIFLKFFFNRYAITFIVYFTNSILYLGIVLASLYFFLRVARYRRRLFVSNTWEYLQEEIYLLILGMIEDQAGSKGIFFLPIFFSIFCFILVSNLVGLTPYGFTVTSFIIKTFVLALSFLIGLTLIGIFWQGPSFFLMFVPKGVPLPLVPILMIIEIVSYVSRAFSLAIRLFANMMSGHSLLNILASFAVALSKKSIFFGLVPFIIVLAITFLEVGIAFLQAYVFVVLLCIYLNDSLHAHH